MYIYFLNRHVLAEGDSTLRLIYKDTTIYFIFMNMLLKIVMTIAQKENELQQFFSHCHTKEALYQKIIDYGLKLPRLEDCYLTDEYLVPGCQSKLWVHSTLQEGHMFFQARSDALVSAGLAYLVIYLFSDQKPEDVVKEKITIFETIGIAETLSPSRSNGLASLILKIKQDAIKFLTYRNN